MLRLLDEVDEVLDGKDTASADDVEKLQYTEQVLLAEFLYVIT